MKLVSFLAYSFITVTYQHSINMLLVSESSQYFGPVVGAADLPGSQSLRSAGTSPPRVSGGR